MKTKFFQLATACFFAAILITGCDRDGNTGNGGNDPTDQFETKEEITRGGNPNKLADTAQINTVIPDTMNLNKH